MMLVRFLISICRDGRSGVKGMMGMGMPLEEGLSLYFNPTT